jgi:hypothetical protein
MHARNNQKMLPKMAEVPRVLHVKFLLLWCAELEVKAMMSQHIQIIEHH